MVATCVIGQKFLLLPSVYPKPPLLREMISEHSTPPKRQTMRCLSACDQTSPLYFYLSSEDSGVHVVLSKLQPAAPPIPSASANSKLCRPIPALAKPSTWPFRFPFPGIPQQGKDAESPDSSGSTNAKEAVQLAFDGSVGGPFRCLAIPGQ